MTATFLNQKEKAENSLNDGYQSEEFAEIVVKGIERGDLEVSYGYAEVRRKASPEELNELFTKMNP